ncbi:flagellar hook-basal body complex protein FliE [Metallumcola ferriviriculae]|uniref:Flagellar hook-basal body complex protein FliE n=1 Tax=Metallumcola ferriviriculae TaxID=3039180 RepID=A0AAU0US09_9FIRM|nr:flagellar hook-basal body complex protein FliE [Desulfitibacteraceae bacterium MK1]
MKVDLQTVNPLQTAFKAAGNSKIGETNEGPSFADQLKKAFYEVNDMQVRADKITEQFVAGKVEDIHQVTVATEQANLALQLTVQVRNKIVEAYQEIARMQV